jgi:hypothetical protein
VQDTRTCRNKSVGPVNECDKIIQAALAGQIRDFVSLIRKQLFRTLSIFVRAGNEYPVPF